MIPLPASRKSSYNLLPSRSSRLGSSYSRRAEPTEEDVSEEEDEMDFEERLGLEEEMDGMDGGERGLEHTLEQLGFGQSPFLSRQPGFCVVYADALAV